ncbi:DNA-processing protein DprA [Marinomonas sp. C2222]|uniref:DNA-processing protein DprA n=1 Tax=Marinomonas sargassi TaxID=2984494 RepID=A0ABT2YQ32_9GAMM|nr:DNA-processing protein DprA [Marinomonas sargassi]MCV2402008.1 DNA-processing protein DprA [Marinomonas sargassi]
MDISNINEPNATGLSLVDWLSLSFVSGIGPARLSRLYTYLSHPNLALSDNQQKTDSKQSLLIEPSSKPSGSSIISYEVLTSLKWPDLTAQQAMAYLSTGKLTSEQEAKKAISLAWLAEDNHYILLRHTPYYPDDLEEISTAPAFFYLEGSLKGLSLPKVGIVGARKCTRYGHDITFRLAAELSARGVCVVSGGAIGVDTAAHCGALSSTDSPTIVVMGTGLLHPYPAKNITLFHDVLEKGGALISEYPLMTTPRPHLFPPRNRIISGLSKGVLVTEASVKSGSLISANYAVQQNREVFAVPGRVTDPQSFGCFELLRQGATLIRGVDDILEELPNLGLLKSDQSKPEMEATQSEASSNVSRERIHLAVEESHQDRETFQKLPEDASEAAQVVLKVLDKEEGSPLDFDRLIVMSGLEANQMMQALIELELSSCIENRSGLYFRI